jgi:predicted dehydrogenase
MNRRSFLKSSVAASALALLPKNSLAAESAGQQPSRRIKIGFLGASHSHASEKVRIAQSSAAFDFVGICDETSSVRQRYRDSKIRFISQDQLLQEAEVVAIESEVKDHAKHGKLALEAGKHVHLEKPAADTFDGCKELIALARAKRRLLQLGYMWRFHPGINAIMEAARQGWLGEIYLVRGTINTLIAAEQRPTWAPFPGGTMFELGCHLIDPLIRLMGKPTNVTTALRKQGAFTDDLVDNTVALFEFPKALGTITSATLQPDAGNNRSFEVLGTNGTAKVSPIEPPTLRIHLSKAAGPYAAGTQTIALPSYRRYAPELAHLAEAILEEKPLNVTLDEELLVHEALLRACAMV